MTHQQAVSVIGAPLKQVEQRLRDVASWPKFLLGLLEVTEISFGRYTFVVRDGSARRTVDVAVTAHPGEHRIVWHALNGPKFDGEIRLAEVDAGHTRASLSLTAEPKGFLASLSDFISSSQTAAMLDLQRLEELVAGTPA
jgi:uncharacterized membrane protein